MLFMFVLLLLLLAVPAVRPAGRAFVRCPPCDDDALAHCGTRNTNCELVREPGCGCCFTCALTLGDPCGLYTDRCGSGLHCRALPGELQPLRALVDGRAQCQLLKPRVVESSTEPAKSTSNVPVAAGDPSRAESTQGLQHNPHGKNHRGVGVLPDKHADQVHRHGHDNQQGPCKLSLNRVMMNTLKKDIPQSPMGIYIPNCDRKGYYKRKQCNPSRGKKKGLCWCVNKYGMRVHGSQHMGGSRRCPRHA
uniref:Insulin like growth factor binding protein 5 n=1 Tax=Eptatretus burgeri TaxID=7764 RepID=A0A8C4NDX8_EPTBU